MHTMRAVLGVGIAASLFSVLPTFAKAPAKNFEEAEVVDVTPVTAARAPVRKSVAAPKATAAQPAPVNPLAKTGAAPADPDAANYDATYGTGARSGRNHGRTLETDDTLLSEQPRATLNLETVGKHRFQVESRFDYQRETNTIAGQNQYAFPTQLRYGFADPFEVHVKGNMFTIQESTASTTRGFGDLALGAKWRIAEGAGLVPSLGINADVGIPTGSDNVSNNAVVPAGAALLQWKLPAEFLLDSNTGFDLPPGDGVNSRSTRFTYGLAARRALPMMDQRFQAFVELAGGIPFQSTYAATHQAGGGVSFRLNDHFDTSTFARVGLTDATPNLQTGVGLSWKP